MLKIFNTLTQKKEKFNTIYPGKVNMYVCGVTAYDLCHIGHGRTFIAFDIIVRYLRYIGYKVNYIRNITDIEDKIIYQSCKKQKYFKHITKTIINSMYSDFERLNIIKPEYEPKATDYIKTIINIIDILIKNDNAYIAENGDVMFSVNSCKNYGLLSKQKLSELCIGSRIKIKNNKRNPMDFVLWKISKPNEPYWSSPWGIGRPGWHIECSAISKENFGCNIDIHGGGSDLIFPHHENEIAQSSCAYKNFYVNFWIHTGMVTVNNKKMSKSLNNFLTIRDILKNYNSETVRYFLMSSHYRSQLNYSISNIEKSKRSLQNLYHSIYDIDLKNIKFSENKYFEEKFIKAMDDDFNTPKVYSILFEISREINQLKRKKIKFAQELAYTLLKLGNTIGLLNKNPIDFLQGKDIKRNNSNYNIELLIRKRENARKNGKWILADEIRENLSKLDIILEDNLKGTFWKRK